MELAKIVTFSTVWLGSISRFLHALAPFHDILTFSIITGFLVRLFGGGTFLAAQPVIIDGSSTIIGGIILPLAIHK
jgi:hypothetical protein